MSSLHPSGIQLDYGYADTGERSRLLTRFFHGVYLWMGIALAWSAIVSWACANVAALRFTVSPGISLIATLGAAAISFGFGRYVMRMSIASAIAIFLTYATLIGVAISFIWIAYHQSTIGVAFLLTGGTFVVASLVGFMLKLDLSRLHSILVVAGIGLFLASVANYFIASNGMSWIVTYAIVIIFSGLMATQTQQLKNMALTLGDNSAATERLALLGALVLYISFINVLLSILRILGDRR